MTISLRCAQTRRLLSVGLVAALGVAAAPVGKVQFTDTTLKNGLRVIISEDHAAPVYTIVVQYNVGSRDERKGRTGFAHLFEHMMFKGSENVGQNEHPYLIFMNGGSMNGTTSKDRTMYYGTLPANQLDLGLFLEADRMKSLAITKDNLENQRNAVQEERRSGVDNQPYGKTFEAIDELAYDNFVYEHSVIGSMADLSAASVDDVAAFFKTYYAPNNAVIGIVGDVNTKTTLAKIEQYFGAIPRQPAPAAVDMSEPAAEGRAEAHAGGRARAAAAHRHGVQGSSELVARRRRDRRAGDDSVRRTQRALLRVHRPAEAAVGRRLGVLRRVARARASSGSSGRCCPARPWRSSKRPSTRRSSG